MHHSISLLPNAACLPVVQALQPLANTLRELRIRNAVSLNQRSLLQLSVFRELEVLELKQCGKISWSELREAWKTACMAYEAQAADAVASPTGSAASAMHSKPNMFGGWLPGVGKLSRTSSPSGSTMLAALLKQKSGGGAGPSGFLASLRGRGHGSKAASATQLGKGAVGNGRSSSGGGSNEPSAVRKFLHRKQKQQMGTAATAPGELSLSFISVPSAEEDQTVSEQADCAVADASSLGAGHKQAPAVAASSNDKQQQHMEARPQGRPSDSGSAGVARHLALTSPTSALYRVGSLVWHGTTAAFGTGSLNRQSTTVQAALLDYLAESDSSNGGFSGFNRSKSIGGGDGSPTASEPAGGSRFAPGRKRVSNVKPLPAMPFTKLVSLSFTCSDVTYKRPAAELEAIAVLTTLTHLELGKCKLPDTVLGRLTSLTRLQRLKMSELWSMGDGGMSELAQLTTLKCLSLSEAMNVTAAGLQGLNKLTGLTALALGLSQDLGEGTIAKVASNFPCLRCLEVTASCWGDADCEQLAHVAAEPDLEAAAAAVVAAAQPPMMLWNVSRSPSPSVGLSSRNNSSRLLSAAVSPLSNASSRSNSSLNLNARPASLSSLPSFGSFSRYDHLATSSAEPNPQHPQQLVVLKLHGCCNMQHGGVAALKHLKQLQTLVLDNCKQVQAAEVISQDLLPPQLVSLTLRGMPFGNAFSECVSVPACANYLTRLELASLVAAHSGQLRRVVSFFQNLQELSLAGSTDVDDAAVKQLAFPKLELLNLSGTRVTDQALDQLLHLPALRTLNLKACHLVTDAGLVVLKMCTKLQELDVSECVGVSDQGVCTIMQELDSLVKLSIVGCKAVSREAIRCCPHYLCLKHTL